jgi:hypothetical protein
LKRDYLQEIVKPPLSLDAIGSNASRTESYPIIATASPARMAALKISHVAITASDLMSPRSGTKDRRVAFSRPLGRLTR